jgi:protein tyrosine phosphatase (PTP) superfamily phosphohydrolase (DUF442 family)
VASAGGSYVRFPVRGSQYPSKEFRESLYDFLDAQLAKPGRVFFHCASSNRIGAAWALYHAERKKVPRDKALAMGKAAGLKSLEPVVVEVLGQP